MASLNKSREAALARDVHTISHGIFRDLVVVDRGPTRLHLVDVNEVKELLRSYERYNLGKHFVLAVLHDAPRKEEVVERVCEALCAWR